MPLDNWGTPLRDVVTDVDVRLEVGDANSKLMAFLDSDGRPYEKPYAELVERIGESITPNRVETWKKLFEELGLIFVEDGTLHVTKFGRIVSSSFSSVHDRVEEQKDTVADTAVRVLGVHQLLNPTTTNRDYPSGCDVLPYRAIWKALQALGSLHWEELHRVLLRVMREEDVDDAILLIQSARKKPDYDPQSPSNATLNLGPALYEDGEQAARRMTPWFSAAGFGGLLIDREPTAGRRSLTTLGSKLVPAELARTRKWIDFGNDRAAWFAHLDEVAQEARTATSPQTTPLVSEIEDEDPVFSEVQKVLNDRASGVLFVGPPGTGKSWYARQIAIKLVSGHAEALREVQFHPAYQYEDFVEGYVPLPTGGFQLVNKHVLEMAEVARRTNGPVVLVIDEFTRTDPARVMGEVLTYMDQSLRNVEFRLPSGRPASLPPNLVFFATANLDDRSVDELDAAMERRWTKVKLVPDVQKLARFLQANGMIPAAVSPICTFFGELQQFLPVGHALFRDVKDIPSLERTWEHQIAFLVDKRFRYEPDQRTAVVARWQACLAQVTAPPAGGAGEANAQA